ncbi:hypothetical protein Tco_0003632 [Tanacetum coccineum]
MLNIGRCTNFVKSGRMVESGNFSPQQPPQVQTQTVKTSWLVQMKTKRKLVSKSIGIGNSACSVKRNVLDQDVCDNELELPQVLPVGSIVFPNTCVHNISSVESNVFPRDICGNIGTVNLSVSLKRRCIRESSSAPPRDQELQLPQLAPVGPSVFPNTCNHQSTSVPSRDFNWHTSETPPANSHQFVSQSKTTVGITRYSINNGGNYTDAIHAANADTSSN